MREQRIRGYPASWFSPILAPEAPRKGGRPSRPPKPRTMTIQEYRENRLQEVRRLWLDEGWMVWRIADHLHVHKSTITADLKLLKKRGELPE